MNYDEDDDYDDQWWEDDYYDQQMAEDYKMERQEKPMKQEWIEIDIDPFSDSDLPENDQRVLVWHKGKKRSYFVDFRRTVDWKQLGYTHWMPEPEGPVKLLKFSEIIEGAKTGEKYKRIGWDNENDGYPSHIAYHLLTFTDIVAEDWIEVG